MTPEKFDQWCILEIMGHQTYAGRVSEQAIGGASFVRIDVPFIDDQSPAFTKYFGASSIYSLTPVTEDVAKDAAKRLRQRPLAVVGYTRQQALAFERDEDLDDPFNE